MLEEYFKVKVRMKEKDSFATSGGQNYQKHGEAEQASRNFTLHNICIV